MTATTMHERKDAAHISIWKRSRVSVQEGGCVQEEKLLGQKVVCFSMFLELLIV